MMQTSAMGAKEDMWIQIMQRVALASADCRPEYHSRWTADAAHTHIAVMELQRLVRKDRRGDLL